MEYSRKMFKFVYLNGKRAGKFFHQLQLFVSKKLRNLVSSLIIYVSNLEREKILFKRFILDRSFMVFFSYLGKKSSNDMDISLLDLLMYLKTSDRVLKANTAGYIMHLTFNDDEAKRKIRYVRYMTLVCTFEKSDKNAKIYEP